MSTSTATCSMDSLPPDAFPLIFASLAVTDRLIFRRVSKSWQEICARGCGHITLVPSALKQRCRGVNSNNTRKELRVHDLLLRGDSADQGRNEGDRKDDVDGKDVEAKAGASNGDMNMWQRKRTRGHLPEPLIIPEFKGDDHASTTLPVEVCPTPGQGVAFRVPPKEGDIIPRYEPPSFIIQEAKQKRETRTATSSFGNKSYVPLRSLDVPDCLVALYRSAVGRPSAWILDTRNNGSSLRPLKSNVKELDFSSLADLQCVSVRGCSNLEVIHLPSSITALDSSSCTRLNKITLPSSPAPRAVRGLTALNLNGCRSLLPQGKKGEEQIFGSATTIFTRNLFEADLSSMSGMSEVAVASMLRSATQLVSLSLRYVAKDAMLHALAESTAASSTLRLMDLAFGSKLTDASVQLLVDRAVVLERINLRGCRSISTACYNEVPVFLEQQRLRREKGLDISADSEWQHRSSKRKGDNLFYFANSSSSSFSGRRKR